jgi:hypothetical protein
MHGALDAAPPESVAPMYAYLASDAARDVTDRIFIATGGFVGECCRPRTAFLCYRDHHDSPPWTVDELHSMVGG